MRETWAFGGGEAVHRRHPDVHQDHVGREFTDERRDLGAVGSLSHDLETVGAAEHEGESRAYERVVIYDEQPDSHAAHGSQARTWNPPSPVAPCFANIVLAVLGLALLVASDSGRRV